jgi:hypothetical protein
MSFTNKTPNYNLPQWLGTDKPSWLVDVNGAFSAIDTAIKNAADSGSGADATAKAALETAQTAQNTANDALTQADEANTKSDNANTTAGNAQTAAGTALTNSNSALNKANSALECYSYFQPFEDVVLGAGLTKRSTDFNGISRLILIYYPGLKLMQISYNIACSGTMTQYATNQILPTTNDYCVIKLPFTCTGNLTINNTYAHYKVDTSTTYTNIRFAAGTIRTIGSTGWFCITTISSDGSVITIPENSTVSNMFWVNTKNLGEITLDGWTKIS